MPSGFPITVHLDGQTFKNLREVARYLDVNHKTVEKWIATKEADETLDECVARHADIKRVTYQGKIYKNKAELARELRLKPAEVARIIRRGNDVALVLIQREAKAVARIAAERPRHIDWNAAPVHELVEDLPSLTGPLANVDLTDAYRIPGKGTGTARIAGARCRKHGPIERVFPLQELKTPRQPCLECRKEHKPVRTSRQQRTLGRLVESVGEQGLLVNLDKAELVKVVREGPRTRSEFQVHHAMCAQCGRELKPIWYHHLEKGNVRCPDCPKSRYTAEEVAAKVTTAHGGIVELLEYSGTIHGRNSRFRCHVCGNEWPASVNAIIGSKHNTPTGCPQCSRSGARATVIATTLERLGISYQHEWPVRVPDRQKPLRCDYYVPSHKLVIEYDGDHHFRPSTRQRDPEEAQAAFQDVQERDLDKRDTLLMWGIRTTRIPFWVADVAAEVKNILSGKPSYPDLPDPVDYAARRARLNVR